MLTALESPTPFAAAAAMQPKLSPERQRELARLATALTIAEYRQLDLPVVVGQLTDDAQARFAPDTSLGFFVSRGHSVTVDHNSQQANGTADRLLREQLFGAAQPSTMTFKTAAGQTLERLRPNAYVTARLNAKMMAQKPTVASILRFDAETFGATPAKLLLDFHQDYPGAHHVLSAGWHRDSAISARRPDRLMRVYLLRSAAPTEFLRDRLALRDDGRTAPSLGNLARLHEAPTPAQDAWLAQVKAAGMFFQPQPDEVTLVTADHSWHRSHRPATPVASTFMRLAIQPQR